MSTKVEETVVVNVPVTTVYNQWTQFEEFPHFMSGIKQITQLGDDRMEWVAEIGGIRRQWEAKVLEQVPDTRVSWAATEGATNAGTVAFEDLGGTTRVTLSMEYEPEGLVEKVGDKLNVVENQAKKDLQNFKEFIESEGYATGAWRGTVAGTPGAVGIDHAAESRGDSGGAGISGKLATGLGVAAAAAVAGVAVAASGKKDDDETVAVVDEVPVAPATTPIVDDVPVVPATPVIDDVDVIDVDPVPAVDGVPGTGIPSETTGFGDDALLDDDESKRRGTL